MVHHKENKTKYIRYNKHIHKLAHGSPDTHARTHTHTDTRIHIHKYEGEHN